MPALKFAPERSTIPTFMLTQTRVIRAPRSRVYEAWTTPAMMQKWFGPVGLQCPSVEIDARTGGAYRIEFAPRAAATEGGGCDSQNNAAFGHYTKVIRNELLQFTWSSNFRPGEDSLVTVSLQDVDGGTEVTILHENFNTEASRDSHNQGWAGCLQGLAAMLES